MDKTLKKAFEERKARKPAAPKLVKEPAAPPEEETADLFVRIKKLNRKGDHFPASCVEIVRVKGREVLSREVITEPDMMEMTVTRAEEILERGDLEHGEFIPEGA